MGVGKPVGFKNPPTHWLLQGEMGIRAKGAILLPAVVAKEATETLQGWSLPFVFSGEAFLKRILLEERRNDYVDSTNQYD